MQQDRLNSIVWQKGDRVTKAGVYSNMPINRYHRADICAGPSISSSGLRTILLESPAHYWCRSPLNPKRIAEPTPRHFVIGRAMHHLMFGEAHFSKVFVGCPKYTMLADGTAVPWSLKTRHAQEWKQQQYNAGKEIIQPQEAVHIEGMARSLAANPFVKKHGIFDGYVERSAFWKDEETGIWLKVRPDIIPGDSGDFVDFKTTTTTNKLELIRAVEKNGYAMQFALMREVFRKLKLHWGSATLVFVEKEPPYCVRVLTVEPDELDLGQRQNRDALHQFARCLVSREWPGPGGTASDAEPIRLTERYHEWAEKQLSYNRAGERA